MAPLTVMPWQTAPLGVEIDAVVVRVPSHVIQSDEKGRREGPHTSIKYITSSSTADRSR